MAIHDLLIRLNPLKRFNVETLSIVCRNASNEANKPPASIEVVKHPDSDFVDTKTHTGMTFEKKDYRLSRFIGNKQKLVNTRFAINLVDEIAPTPVKDRFVYCDGGGPLGHPRVFINLDQPGNHKCGYCGLRYFQEHHH